MRHLTDAEFVDLVEGQLEGERAGHAKACTACRVQAEALGVALASARRDAIPEPSPIFWDHLSARISLAIDAQPAPRRSWLAAAARWPLAAAAVAVVLAAGLTWQVFLTRDPVVPPAVVSEQRVADQQADPDADGFVDAWDALETVAQDLDWEDAQSIGIASRPGSAERLVGDLTADERSELARLIEEEMKRLGA